VSEESPGRIAVIWSSEARADLRSIDREIAIQILHCIDRYLSSRTGDVKKLKPPEAGLRLRCGDYRVFFDHSGETTLPRASPLWTTPVLPLPVENAHRMMRSYANSA
jgi:mRNA-degrading endonuclease RelE of RelBE toxin-antitoxin system